MIRIRLPIAGMVTLAAGLALIYAQEWQPRKFALLVGVWDYQAMPKLKYTSNDVEDLAKVLKDRARYRRIVVMTKERTANDASLEPSCDNILEEYLTSTVPLDVKEQKGNLVRQTPSRVGEIVGKVALADMGADFTPPVPPKGGTTNLVLDLGGSVKMEFVKIKAGTFTMGDDGHKPPHRVTLTRDYYLGKYTVTQEQYKKIAAKNPSYYSGDGGGKDKIAGMDTKRFPVEEISWNAAKEFCEKLSRLTGGRCDLPTEAEWEYACRAGSTSRYFFGDSEDELKKYAWFDGNSASRTHDVGTKQVNPWGLYDMHGNVWQWCADWYGKKYYGESPKEDPQGPSTGTYRVLRGGSWDDRPRTCRSAFRFWNEPSSRNSLIGFRVLVRLD